jgi:Tol biopolymer transport system component
MDTNGKNLIRLTDNSDWDDDPSWSPDSKKIVFWSSDGTNYKIYCIDADGQNQKKLAEGSQPAWQPFASAQDKPVPNQKK